VIDELLSGDQFVSTTLEREQVLFPLLLELTTMHRDKCDGYRRMLAAANWSLPECRQLSDLPFVPVGAFKRIRLASVAPEDVFAVIQSSGTTGQSPSQIVLDRRTAHLQTRALASVLRTVIPARVPLLILDRESELRSPSARGVGIRGMLPLGRDHAFAFNHDMSVNLQSVRSWTARAAGRSWAMFGFTFLAWSFLQQIRTEGLDCSDATLLHSGGWKKLAASGVSNDAFKAAWREGAGLTRVFNFYGMAEQVGSVFLEGEDGLLYAPACADVIIRDPQTWRPAPIGVPGVIQVLSALPHSYPGHSILTEDVGVIEGVDDGPCGRRGKYFRVTGRVARAELRGCSDVAAVGA
jgi:Acyl-protein synthetase, LuxE